MKATPRIVRRYCHGPDCLCTREHLNGAVLVCVYCRRAKLFLVHPVGGN